MLKKILKKIIYGYKCDSKSFIKHLNKIGAIVSEQVYFVSPKDTTIDETRPYLIEIGKNVTITEGCKILTHGFDWSVLKVKYADVIGSAGKVCIKDNCFIGVNSIILKGVSIGPNSIVGAGSVVTKDIPPNTVAAGNPCKVICTLEDYYKKRKDSYEDEVCELITSYYKRFNQYPDIEEVAEFFELFEQIDMNNKVIIRKINYGGNSEKTLQKYEHSNKKYKSVRYLCDYITSKL